MLQRITGTFSGNLASGVPLGYTVSFGSPFVGEYLVNVESSALRLFTVSDKTQNGFVINTNSSQSFVETVYWQACFF
jgi:hypothetical protein